MYLKSIRTVFFTLAICLGALYGWHLYQRGEGWTSWALFATSTLGIGVGLIIVSIKISETSLRYLNITILGLIFGCLTAQLLITLLKTVDAFSLFRISEDSLLFLQMGVHLICSYLGILLVWQAQDQWALSIPFIRLIPSENKKRDFLLDGAILADPRLIDLAITGLFDHRLIVPRFVLTEFKKYIDSESEVEKQKSRRVMEILQKLEEIPGLHLTLIEHDFPDIKDQNHKLIQLARLLDTHILTADPSGINARAYEGVKFINIFTLSNALKPIVQTGETIPIKIQRYGKEPLQGVGYLDDGTMVVVNGGADYLGDTIQVQVLSVKHTPTGRMIFCNSASEKKGVNSSSKSKLNYGTV